MGRVLNGKAKEALAYKYAKLIASGTPEFEAWKECFPAKAKKDAPQTQWNMHSKWRHDPIVMRAVLDATKPISLPDLDNQALAIMSLLQDIAAAKADKNHTALAALNRLRLQVNNLLKEQMTVTDERAMPDSKLLELLAKATGVDTASLAPLLGRSGFSNEEDETKH